MTLELRCRCGQVQGTVDARRAYARATCYCRDCQAYARHLGQPGVMDAQGGTDIIAMNPDAVTFTAGEEHIAGHIRGSMRIRASHIQPLHEGHL